MSTSFTNQVVAQIALFNEKFAPEWTPRYAAYPSLATLPRIALAAMLAEAYVTLPRLPGRRRAR